MRWMERLYVGAGEALLALRLLRGGFGPEAGPFWEASPVVGADLGGEVRAEEEFGVGNSVIEGSE